MISCFIPLRSGLADGTVTVEIYSYPTQVCPGSLSTVRVRLKFEGDDNDGPWQVNWIALKDDDVGVWQTITDVENPLVISQMGRWYSNTFNNVNLGAYDDGGNGVELYAEAEVNDNDFNFFDPNGSSSIKQVTVGSGPSAPAGGTPHNTTLTSSPSKLDWSDTSGATSYDVYLNNSFRGNVTASEWSLNLTLSPGNHNWHVIAKNSCGSTTGPTWSFTVSCPNPSTPTGGTPHNATLTSSPSKLDWSNTSGATSYDVYLNNSFRGNVTTSEWFLNLTLSPGNHNWYVIAKNSCGSTTGPTWSFTISCPNPSTPSGGSPHNTTLTSSPSKLDWSDTSGATSYDVYLNNSFRGNVTASEWTLNLTLSPGNHSWYVIAKNGCGNTAGPTWSFTISKPVTITAFNPPTATVEPGTRQQVTVQFKNTGAVARKFWVGLSFEGLNAEEWPGIGWLDVPPIQVPRATDPDLAPGGTASVTFEFSLPDWMPDGAYVAHTAIWNDFNDAATEYTVNGKTFTVAGLMVGELDRASSNAFTIVPSSETDRYGLAGNDPGGLYANIPQRYRSANLLELPQNKSSTLRDANQDLLSSSTKNVLVLFHGWRSRDPYQSGEFLTLKNNLLASGKLPSDWRLVPYAWGEDSETGFWLWRDRDATDNGITQSVARDDAVTMTLSADGETVQSIALEPVTVVLALAYVAVEAAEQNIAANSTVAAYRAYMHGLVLGERLCTNVGTTNLKKVHIVAHSAGSWGAYAALRYLRQNAPNAEVQVTYLDPFIPASILSNVQEVMSFLGIWASGGVFDSAKLDSTRNYASVTTPGAFDADCYWSLSDETFWGGVLAANVQDVIGRSFSPVVNLVENQISPKLQDSTKVTWTWSGSSIKTSQTDAFGYSGHSAPIQYYADSVNSPNGVNFAGMAWQKSLAANSFTVPTRIIGLSGNLAFGNVQVGATAQRTLAISNSGNSTLNVSGISYPSGFSGAWSGNLGAGASTNVTVTFAPSQAIPYGGTVTVNSDATNGNNTINSSGNGVAAPTRIISLSGNLAFGNVQVGAAAQRTLTISNSGNSTLNVSSISYPSGFSGAWSGNLGAGGSTNITVTFAPTTNAPYGDTVTVNSDATGGSNTISASGTGTPEPQPSISRSPSSITNIVQQGQNAAAKNFQVWNSGSGTLFYTNSESVNWITSIVQATGSSTGGTNSHTINFGTTSLLPGTNNATITISGNASPSQTINVTLIVTGPVTRTVRVANSTGSPNNTISIPVEMVAQGDENAIGFSLTNDNSVLSFVSAQLGTDTLAASATLLVNSNQLAMGRVGISISLPPGQTIAAGTRQLLTATYLVAGGTSAGNTVIGLGDQPISRDIIDTSLNSLAANWSFGTVSINQCIGYEGDVSPRPNGDSQLKLADWAQVGRFYAQLDTPSNGCEFEKADSYPRPCGNGVITLADWAQAGRYYAQLDAVTAPCGPTAPSAQALESSELNAQALGGVASERAVLALDMNVQQGDTNSVSIILDAQGDENALGFSLSFDTNLLSFVTAQLGSDAATAGAQFLTNTLQASEGRVGVSVALPGGQSFVAGTKSIAVVTFAAKNVGSTTNTSVSFGDQPIARDIIDAGLNSLVSSYSNATVTITGAASVINHVLSIASSNPNSDVFITVSPADTNGTSSGSTQFNLIYTNGTLVTLTAPGTASSNSFLKWQRNGADYTTNLVANITMTTNWTMTAVYTNQEVSLPVVTITASAPTASEGFLFNNGTFTIGRSGGSILSSLTVHFTVSGSASPGFDYPALISPVTIQPLANTAQLTVSPNDDQLVEGAETVAVTLVPNAAYTIGSGSAMVTILDDDFPTICLSTTTITNSVLEGQNASNQTFQVRNCGQGTLNYSITVNVPWLSVSPTNGTSTGESDTIQVIYNTTGLSESVTNATIMVAGNSNNSPQAIQVTLIVLPDESCILGEALDNTVLTWSNTTWECQNVVTHDGVDAAISGEIGDSQTSTFSTVVEGPGTVNFWWKVSSEHGYDFLRFSINGVAQAAISGEEEWNEQSFSVPTGNHTLEWRYTKDPSFAHGDDAGFVDEVRWKIEVLPPCPDLSGSWGPVKSKCKNKKGVLTCKLSGKLAIPNTGDADASESIVRFYLSDDANLDAGDALIGESTVKALAAGKVGKAKLKVELNDNPSGKYLIAVIDAGDDVAECDEDNNTATNGPLP